MEPLPEFFVPCNHTDIIIRMLNNLLVVYQQDKYEQLITSLKKLRDHLEQL
jgi:hypothetical protein